MADYHQLLQRIDELRKAGQTLAEVAERLNQEGFRPPKRAAAFPKSILNHLLWGRGTSGTRLQALRDGDLLGEHEWLLTDLAKQLGMPPVTLHRWIRVGWVHARKLATARGHWVIWADRDEQERMTQLRNCPRGWADEPRFEALTQPKARDQK